MAPANTDDPELQKKSGCQRVFQSRLCLPAVFLAVAAGVAATVVVVLVSPSIRRRFPPDQKWWQKGVVYQVYPRSFQDSDSDGLGDLKGITSRLDHFTDLKVKAIWLSPFYPSPMVDFGYDVKNFTDVDPRFGTLADFDDLVAKAHKKGLKVVVDFVAGHTSSEHEWFQMSVDRIPPYEDYYIWSNGTTLNNGTQVPPNNWMSAFGYSAWTWNDARQQFYYHSFLPQQPTLNYRNESVVEEMKDVLRFWLERGVDGIRVDAATRIMVAPDLHQDQVRSYAPDAQWWQPEYYINNLTNDRPEIGDIVRGWRAVLDDDEDSDDDEDNSKVLIMELFGLNAEERAKYYGYGADIPFNFDLLNALDNHYRVLNANYCDAICIRDVIQTEYDSVPDGKWPNFVLSNHDNHRVASRMGSRYADALNVLLLTVRGTPTTYYGEEIGMQDVSLTFQQTKDPLGLRHKDHYQEVSRDPERSPMQWNDGLNAGFSNASQTWLPVNPDYLTRNVQDQELSPNVTALRVYTALAALRQEPSFRYGLMQFVNVTPDLLSYLRTAAAYPRYLVVINFGNVTVTSRDLSGPPVDADRGKVKVATSQAANEGRFVKDAAVPLTSLSLAPGDGVVFELPEESSSGSVSE